jgi:hypothetical protein
MRETTFLSPTSARPTERTTVATSVGLHAPLSLTVASTGLALGVAADSLFHDGVGPVAFAVWVALVALGLIALVWRDHRALPRESAFWLISAIVFASCLAWRDAGILQFFDTVATLGCLGLAVVRLRDSRAGILAERMRDTVVAGIRAGLETAFGVLPLAMHEIRVPGRSSSVASRARTILHLALIAIAILLVFGSLLREADPIFASVARIPALDVGNIVAHTLTILFVGAIVAGWSRSALLPRSDLGVPGGFGFSLGAAEVMTILGTLNVLFAAFVVTQLGWFFGGEQFLRARTGLTAAQYARGGFFQLLWVVALVVPVLVVSRGALREGRALARRHTTLAVPIVALLGTMIACSVARLNLYVTIYGLTTDRLYPLVFMAWLFATLLWLSVTVLRDWSRPFALGATLSAMVTLFTLNALDPEAFIARVNVDGAAHTLRPDAERLDVEYLAGLSGGAVPYAVRALTSPRNDGTLSIDDDAHRCAAAKKLISRFGPARADRGGGPVDVDASWRFWNADDAVASSVVSRHFVELIAVRHSACAASRTASTGEAPNAR